MDVYTTSFCLPYRATLQDLEDHSPSFELPRDVAAAAAANNHPRHSSHQQQPQHNLNSNSNNSNNNPRHQVHRSISSYSRPASIPEDREDGLNVLGESTSSSSTGGSRFGGLSHNPLSGLPSYGQVSSSNGSNGPSSTIVGGGNTAPAGLVARRSTSSIASLGQQTNTTAASSIAGDAASTAPSSQFGHGMAPFSNPGTGISSVPPHKLPSNTGSAGSGTNDSDLTTESVAAMNAANQQANAELAEAMQKLCMEAMSHFQCMVTCSPVEVISTHNQGHTTPTSKLHPSYNFILSGGYPQVMGARGYILRSSPFKRKSIVKVPRNEVLVGSGNNNNSQNQEERVRPEMKKKLDEIASLTRAHLAIVGQVSSHIGFGLEIERSVEIVITGTYESVEQARVRLLVLLDELVSSLFFLCYFCTWAFWSRRRG